MSCLIVYDNNGKILREYHYLDDTQPKDKEMIADIIDEVIEFGYSYQIIDEDGI